VSFVADGDAYHFLALILLALVAGPVLAVSLLFCLFRYRDLKSGLIGFVFVLFWVIGVLDAWHFFPHFRISPFAADGSIRLAPLAQDRLG